MRGQLRVRLEKVGALVQGLVVGIDLAQLFLAGIRQGQQGVLDFHSDRPHDVQVILQHQVIVVGDRTGKGVLNRDDSVVARSAADRLKHILEVGKELDFRLVKNGQTCLMGEGSGDSLAGSLCRSTQGLWLVAADD